MDLNTTLCIGSIEFLAYAAFESVEFKYNTLYRFNVLEQCTKHLQNKNLNTTLCIGSILLVSSVNLGNIYLNTTLCIGSIRNFKYHYIVREPYLNTTLCIGSMLSSLGLEELILLFKYNTLYRFNTLV